ncbi:MAG TPA: dienelactone hydrolase family protein [Blastocatellia bacterium]|nr:dienelactone hydrolase family protein [Blastocatellia bacterium]
MKRKMTDEKKDKERKDESLSGLSRREFVAFSLAAGLDAATRSASGKERPVIETDVDVKTPDGTCDAVFIHPTKGSHPGVLVWHDSPGLRPVMRGLGKRIAAEGYSVLVPNCFYRAARAPVFDASFDYANNPADREKYRGITAPFFAPGAAERDAVAYVAFLDAQGQVNKKKKIGTHGYCLGGRYVMRTAAALPDRVGAGASFHGGLLVTDKPDSTHLLAPKIKARMYFAIASDDDKREPEVKNKLREAFAAAKVRAEIEVYPNALHGWCVPDDGIGSGGVRRQSESKPSDNKTDAERAWAKLVALYKEAL